jgi:hypothetical protein
MNTIIIAAIQEGVMPYGENSVFHPLPIMKAKTIDIPMSAINAGLSPEFDLLVMSAFLFLPGLFFVIGFETYIFADRYMF